MITVETADKALKEIYLSVINEELDKNISPFYSVIEKTSGNVNGGKIQKLVPFGFNGGISATSEAGSLPQSGGNRYASLTVDLKNLYGTIEISDKALKASQSTDGSLVNLLSAEMEGLLRSSKQNFARMLFGDGSGLLAEAVSSTGNVVTLDSLMNVETGMIIDIIDTSGDIIRASKRTIISMDRDNCTITIDGLTIPPILNTTTAVFMQSSRKNELTGLRAIFGSKDIYGLKRSDYDLLRPLKIDYDEDLSLGDQIHYIVDELMSYSGSLPNMIICSPYIKRQLVNQFKKDGVILNTLELDGGYKALSFNGIPIIAERYCRKQDLFVVNTDDFKFHQLSDWRWLESDGGSVLKQMNGYAGYSATLVKYGDLVCHYPKGQGFLANITL